MSGTTPRMGLKTWDNADPFLRQDFNEIWAKIDAHAPPYICTSSTRPAWGASQAGMRIVEQDTRRVLMWSGTSWQELQSAPPVYPGYTNPDVAVGNNSHVYYKLATFTVERPGALAIWLSAQVQCQSTFTMNFRVRSQVDGNDCMIGDTASIIRVERVHTSGNGWSRHYQVPALGLRSVGVGSHNFGVHFYTDPDSTTSGATGRLVSVRGLAMIVNDFDV